MKEYKLYEGELCDDALEKVIPSVINKAVLLKDDVFLRWNGKTMRVTPKSTLDEVLGDYETQCSESGIVYRKQVGELIDTEVLAKKIVNILKNL